MLTLEERIKRIEDELGFTAKDREKKLQADACELFLAYGFSKKDSKNRAFGAKHDGYSLDYIEMNLISRGAEKIVCAS